MEKPLSDELINSLTKDELWEMLFLSKYEVEPYNQDFSYDDMKIMFSLYKYAGGTGIDYEDLCFIATTIRCLWNAAFAKKHHFPSILKTNFGKIVWRIIELEPKYAKLSRVSEGYSQSYTFEIGKDIVTKYLEFTRKQF
jgi:hypothetical protein